jgi:hypothetical protein
MRAPFLADAARRPDNGTTVAPLVGQALSSTV